MKLLKMEFIYKVIQQNPANLITVLLLHQVTPLICLNNSNIVVVVIRQVQIEKSSSQKNNIVRAYYGGRKITKIK
jgi:type IV secretory pathway VirB3-like protein